MRSIETDGAAGFKPKRIGVAFALKAHGLELGEAFDVAAGAHEIVDALEEIDERLCARRAIEADALRREAAPGDLTGAACDDHAQAGFVIDDDGFEMDAGVGILRVHLQRFGLEDDFAHQADLLARSFPAAADRVRREEVAQDDPEPVHAHNLTRPSGRRVQRGYILQIQTRET